MRKSFLRPSAKASVGEETIVIEALGALGDGVGQLQGKTVHVPFALPGERVRVRVDAAGRARLVAIETESADRCPPSCAHFGACGGCVLQHLKEEAGLAFKAARVEAELARARIRPAEVLPVKTYPLPSRRRVTLSARKHGGRVLIGFKALGSHDLVEISDCPILRPELSAVLPAFREGLACALAEGADARVHLALAANGLDATVEGAPIAKGAIAPLIEALAPTTVIRLSFAGELLLQRAQPCCVFAGVSVPMPTQAFLQAVEACETDMAAFVTACLKDTGTSKGPVCDLFAGLGAFTFGLARTAPVSAFEIDGAAVEALTAGARGARGLKPVMAVRRDLFRNPLTFQELKTFAAAIIDPPREGALAQTKALAASGLSVIVAVSCNLATFARDATFLAEAGFSLDRLAVFDQFKFSPHIELAALFVRKSRQKKGWAKAHP